VINIVFLNINFQYDNLFLYDNLIYYMIIFEPNVAFLFAEIWEIYYFCKYIISLIDFLHVTGNVRQMAIQAI